MALSCCNCVEVEFSWMKLFHLDPFGPACRGAIFFHWRHGQAVWLLDWRRFQACRQKAPNLGIQNFTCLSLVALKHVPFFWVLKVCKKILLNESQLEKKQTKHGCGYGLASLVKPFSFSLVVARLRRGVAVAAGLDRKKATPGSRKNIRCEHLMFASC